MIRPWSDTFAVTTPDDESIVVRRSFGVPPDRVWRAMTEPQHLRRWLGSPDFPLTTCEIDLRVGGRYRWVFTRPGGQGAMGVSGTYDEVSRPGLLVSTEQFDDFPGPSRNTLELVETGERATAMTVTIRYVDAAMRDAWLASGMADGMAAGYDRLDLILAETG